jgi:hypothetical protein
MSERIHPSSHFLFQWKRGFGLTDLLLSKAARGICVFEHETSQLKLREF